MFWVYYNTLCCCKLIRAGGIRELVDEAIPAARKCHVLLPGSLLILIVFFYYYSSYSIVFYSSVEADSCILNITALAFYLLISQVLRLSQYTSVMKVT